MALKKLKRKMSPMKPVAKAANKTANKKPAAKAAAKKPVTKPVTKPPAPKAVAKAKKPVARPKAAPPPPPPAPVEKKPWLFPPVVHWEIQATDAPKQRAFFGDLFGWSIDANNPQNYGMVGAAGDGAIGGGIGPTHDGKSYVTFYVEVPDINAALAKAESLGASTVMPRTDIGMIILGQFRDPEGNVIGLIESKPS